MRDQILDRAKALTCGDRDVSYGSPVRNMADIAALWTTYLERKYDFPERLTGEDVAWLMVFVKSARSFKSMKLDNYDDAAAYSAIAGECRNVAERASDRLEELARAPEDV